MNEAVRSAGIASQPEANAVEPARDEELAYTIGLQAYIYGYPMMDLYRTMWETSFDPNRGHDRTINEFFFIRRLATHEDEWVVTPNNDTIYHRAFLDLRAEPIVLVIPPTGRRFYWFPIGDMHHDFDGHLSWDTVGSRGGNFALCPPGWQGALPEGVTRIDVSTPIIWLLGRFAVDGIEDLPAAAELQDHLKLVPISQWEQSKVDRPNINPAAYPKFTRNDLTDANNYFTTMNEVLRMAPRLNNTIDEGIFGWLREINMHPSQRFNWETLSCPARRGLSRAAAEGQRIISNRQRRAVPIVNNWQIARLRQKGSDNPVVAAASAMLGLLYNPRDVSTYDVAFSDAAGAELQGSKRYVLHLAPPPPVNAFWSVTMYSAKTFRLVESAINRYSIGDRTKGIMYGSDGSLDIFIQHEEPGVEAEWANWLPAPEGHFYLAMRHYSPKAAILNGDWSPMAVQMR
ncbi:membrane protein [Steroidobacter agaridevorans]|uniref:Membrane protein n=1 Tax=Steroidobacter agaridevorans TaxID=2695856 RepID=A0A829YHZ9_9GAMM|nr:DUF1254 domain-containing protein [Steroidobacter agaridevorans]GFE82503.1 membrane protein [Steroidobacter agaridevorans]